MRPFFFTHYLVLYDVADSRRCVQANNICRAFCFQQQNSVFEGELTPSQLEHLKEALLQIINRREDNIIIYPLGKPNILGKEVYGQLKYRVKRIF